MRKIIVLAALVFLASRSMSQTPSPMMATPSSHFIPIDSANKMIMSYLFSVATPPDTNLYSVIFDADALRLMLNDSSRGKISKVKVMFAHTLSYIKAGGGGKPCGYRSGKLTLIMAGYDDQGNYVYTPVGSVLDTGIPCPTSCPTAGTAANNTLQ